MFLRRKSHPNIIKVNDLLEDDFNYYIVTEIAQGGDIMTRLSKIQSYSENQIADVVY